jgi:hypothetical protein
MTITKKLPIKRGDNLKIQKVLSSEKIQNVDLNVEKECNRLNNQTRAYSTQIKIINGLGWKYGILPIFLLNM